MTFRIRPLVRMHVDDRCWWVCDLCQTCGGAFPAAWVHDAARAHYRDVHIPGMQRLLAAVRSLP